MGSGSFFNLTYDKECSFSSRIMAPLRVIETFFDDWPSADSFSVDPSDLAWSLSSGPFSSFIPSNSGIVLKRVLLFYLEKPMILLWIWISTFQPPFDIIQVMIPIKFYTNHEYLMQFNIWNNFICSMWSITNTIYCK